MSDIIVPSKQIEPLPLPSVDVAIRPAVMGDLPFIDRLQKLHAKQVGWMPMKQLEGKIAAGQVIVAEEVGGGQWAVGGKDKDKLSLSAVTTSASSLPTAHCPPPTPVGYCIASDQYFKRDEVGIIYQMNVVPGRQRGLIGATLLKAQFERSAYGCKLYCCWCAQDIEANRFWEAMGFVPLAFRAGSEKKSRVHIFWQKRIVQGDTATPWWFPSKTAGGSIREDRIVLPIPQGSHWSDAKPMILPGAGEGAALPGPKPAETLKAAEKRSQRAAKPNAAKPKAATQDEAPPPIRRNGLMFDIPQPGEPLPEAKPAGEKTPKREKAESQKTKRVCDPRLVSAARELRDRWLERVNASPLEAQGKYEVARPIADRQGASMIEQTNRQGATTPAVPLLAA